MRLYRKIELIEQGRTLIPYLNDIPNLTLVFVDDMEKLRKKLYKTLKKEKLTYPMKLRVKRIKNWKEIEKATNEPTFDRNNVKDLLKFKYDFYLINDISELKEFAYSTIILEAVDVFPITFNIGIPIDNYKYNNIWG